MMTQSIWICRKYQWGPQSRAHIQPSALLTTRQPTTSLASSLLFVIKAAKLLTTSFSS